MQELLREDVPQSQRSFLPMLTVYMICFYLVWTLKAIWLNPFLEHLLLPSHPIYHVIASEGIKFLIWVIPAFLIVKDYFGENPLTFLKLNTNIWWGLAWGLMIGLVYVSILLIIAHFRGGPLFHWHQPLNTWIGGIILVGFIEELPFRGLLLQTLMRRTTFLRANLIVSTLFLFMHFPGWYAHHYPVVFFLINGCGVLIRALVFAWFVKKTDSLWSSIVLHMLNNFGHMVILPL